MWKISENSTTFGRVFVKSCCAKEQKTVGCGDSIEGKSEWAGEGGTAKRQSDIHTIGEQRERKGRKVKNNRGITRYL